ncbi:TPA: hypothetical protein DCQ22_03745 [Candidatus Nomurabacteria bacterium]|nr:hypothetical protein [Candidatus Nomurabacteria bacterium]HBY20751.1 hypothetical protein [Clostridiales bacterium]
MENLAEFYFEKLPLDSNPGLLLAKFFCQSTNTTLSKSEIIMFNRLIKLYGRTIPYFAILDVNSMNDVNLDNPFGILSYFCKKRIEQKNPEVYNGAYNNLDKNIEKLGEQIAAQEGRKPLKVKELD